MRTLLSTILVTLFTLTCGFAHADKLTAQEIVEKASEAFYYQGKDQRSFVKMTITGRNGKTRGRSFTTLRRNDSGKGGDQSFYTYFHEPADVSRMVFIAKKKVGGSDERWLYLPALDLVKRIAASDKRTSFVGSNFYYEDVSGRNVTADNHKLVQTTKTFYVIESTPKDGGDVEFASSKTWVHRASFIPTKIEYYDKKAKTIRVMTVDKVGKIQGYTVPTKATIADPVAGTKTTVEFSSEYDVGLPAKLFGERYLRRAPLKYLK